MLLDLRVKTAYLKIKRIDLKRSRSTYRFSVSSTNPCCRTLLLESHCTTGSNLSAYPLQVTRQYSGIILIAVYFLSAIVTSTTCSLHH